MAPMMAKAEAIIQSHLEDETFVEEPVIVKSEQYESQLKKEIKEKETSIITDANSYKAIGNTGKFSWRSWFTLLLLIVAIALAGLVAFVLRMKSLKVRRVAATERVERLKWMASAHD